MKTYTLTPKGTPRDLINIKIILTTITNIRVLHIINLINRQSFRCWQRKALLEQLKLMIVTTKKLIPKE